MSNAATLNNTIASVGLITDKFNFSAPPKSVTQIQKVMQITTDKKSVISSGKLVEFLSLVKTKLLPEKEDAINHVSVIKKNLDNTNECLLSVNSFFETIKHLFEDTDDNVIIDNTNMVKLIENMKKAQTNLQYISDYLTLVLTVQKSKAEIKSGKAKAYSFEEIECLLKASC